MTGGTFASLSIPSFRRYAAGAAASNVGTWMHRVGQAWLVLELTGSPAVLGVATALQFAPMLLVGPWAGVLADRVDRRRLLMATQTALAVQALILGFLVLAGWATPFVVLGAALALGLVTAVDAPARQSVVSDLVDEDHLVNAVALNSASFNAARLVGPAVAGLIIAVWGTGWVFVVNSLTFAAMLAALASIRLAARSRVRGAGGIRDGLRHVRQRPDLVYVIALVGAVSMFALNFQMTIAIMATEVFDADARVYGLLGSVMAVGSLAGSLLAARRARTSLPLITAAAVGLGAATAVAGLMPNAWLFGAALVAAGVSGLTMMTSANAYLQTHAGAEHRSRVMALYLAVFFGTTPVSAPLIGWLADVHGGRAALVVPGLAALVVAVVFARLRGRGRWHPQPGPDQPAAADGAGRGEVRPGTPGRYILTG